MILAIDPGIKGAYAAYDPDLNLLVTKPLPTRWKLVNGKKRFEIDIPAMWLELVKWTPDVIIVEEPHGMPGAGAISQFNFGLTCGALLAMLENYYWRVKETSGREIQVVRVSPSVWKAAMSCPSDKNRARALAADYFPEHNSQFKNAGDDGRAEAALLAAYHVAGHRPKQKMRTPVVKRQAKKPAPAPAKATKTIRAKRAA